MNEVLQRTLELLEQKGMTSYQLCKKIGINQNTFSTWKTKDRIPPADRLSDIANALGVSVDYLITGENRNRYYLDPEAAEIAKELYERPELKVLFKTARKVSPEDMKVVQTMIDALSKKGE